jgi:small-conductance mechanosensitive channel
MDLETNKITKDDRTFRIILGVLLVIGALFGFGSLFFIIIGGLTVASGVTGLCVIKSLLK